MGFFPITWTVFPETFHNFPIIKALRPMSEKPQRQSSAEAESLSITHLIRKAAPSLCVAREADPPPRLRPDGLCSSTLSGEGVRGNIRTGSPGVHGGRAPYQTGSGQSTGRVNRTGGLPNGALGCRSTSDCQLPKWSRKIGACSRFPSAM